METEQRFKFTEDIRKILCHGRRHLEKGEPFAAQAEDMAIALWNLGYRPDMAKSTIFHRLHQETEAAWIQMWSLEKVILDELNGIEPEHPKYAGLLFAHNEIGDRLARLTDKRDHWNTEFEKALVEEGFNE